MTFSAIPLKLFVAAKYKKRKLMTILFADVER